MNFLKKMTRLPLLGVIVSKLLNLALNYKAQVMASHFSEYLQPMKASSDYLKERAFNVRHQVYCEELNFEPLDKDKLEVDEFDKQSIHCLIQHRRTKKFAGTVRIVCSKSDSELLPIEKYCNSSITHPKLRPENFDRRTICEISRLAVPETFRRRKVDQFKGAATGAINEKVYSEKELRCFPFIAVGLYLSAANLVIEEGIEHVFVMMEPRLARSLKLVGITFTQIGPVVDYHGRRAPYYIDPVKEMNKLSPGFKKLNKNIRNEITHSNDGEIVSGEIPTVVA